MAANALAPLPKPWTVERDSQRIPGRRCQCFVLAHVYGQPDSAIAFSDNRLTNDETRPQWLRPELRVRVKHLKAKGVLRHATVKQLITD